MPGRLNKLPEDLLLRILFLTDIYTVLTISQLHRRSNCGSSLTRDLFLRGLIDTPSDEVSLSLSSDKLIAQVKRAVCGPRTWSPTSPTAPTLTHQFTIQLERPAFFSSLLPGGRYIVFQRLQSVECCKVSTGRRVWSWDRSDSQVLEMAFSACRGSRVTVFLTVWGPIPPADVQLVILEVDLDDGHICEILQFPSMGVAGLRLKNLQSAEGYFGCVMLPPRNEASGHRKLPFLINLHTEQYILLDYKLATKNDLHIIPGHILLIGPPWKPLSVRVYTILSLERFWRPLSDFNLENTTSESMIASATVPLEDTGDNARSTRQVEVFVTASLLRQNTYLLRVFDTGRYTGTTIRTLSRHLLDLSKQTPQCTPISESTQSMGEPMLVSAVSRAGYSVLSSSEVGFRMQQDDKQESFVNFETVQRRSPSQVALPHNGGLVIVHETHAELLYYD
ncbi:F-box domain-containing protein [Mycena sanguinolenta]|uniref:F-box domain-containing protein n=1 Tax=Mycena sanguinolenta TaxID=230812 RepID=A0A8H6X4C3_9AGAR|nr:F-box domain-containing protein [Mycena sanguinolenta]